MICKRGAGLILTTLALHTSPASAQLCKELHGLEPGQTIRDHALSIAAHVGAGWNFAPSGSRNRDGGGPVGGFAFSLDRTAATRSCTTDGDYEISLSPHGLRAGFSAAAGRRDFFAAGVHAGYLHTGSSLRWWLAPEVLAVGVSSDSAGIAAGVNAGFSVFEWLGLRAQPSFNIAGSGSYDSGGNFMLSVMVSPAFLREHFGK